MNDDLTPDLLLRAYAAGIFPMAERADSDEVFWVNPDTRGIIPLDGLIVSRSLRKAVRRERFALRCDTAFAEVMRACAAPSETRGQTWINATIRDLYTELHHLGFAHSVECWQGSDLVGGLYGVSLGGAFFGESMFSRVADASKVALVHLVARLRYGGYALLDAQFVTKHLARLGAIEITRAAYMRRLAAALPLAARFYRGPLDAGLASELAALLRQSTTQTS